MTTILTRPTLLFTFTLWISAHCSLPAAADSTAALILSMKCRGGYNVDIWQKYGSGELLYRATSPKGNVSLGRGTSKKTEGVRVYKFRNNSYEYWVWDNSLDNNQSGQLEVYKNDKIQMQRTCKI